MSNRRLNIGLVLIAAMVFSATGCSSPPWRKKPIVSQREKDAYFEQAASRIQYDAAASNAYNYQAQPVAGPPVSQTQGGSCCH